MKKLLVISMLIILVIPPANAQFTKIGGGLALSSGFPFHQQNNSSNRSGVIAVSFTGIYEINAVIHISPSLTIFYPNTTSYLSTKTSISSMMFDLNGHYVINSPGRFEFYGLTGLDILIARRKASYETTPSFTESDNALGLNLGIGTYMKITEKLDLSGEAKYVFNNKYNQFMVNIGILLNTDWMKKNENSGE